MGRRDRWLSPRASNAFRNHTSTLYDEDETILIDDIPTRIESHDDVFVSTTLIRRNDDPELVVCFRTDRDTKYAMSDVVRQFR